MTEAGIGRLLVASLHQAIADVLPTRLEFYEGWLNPAGLRNGRIGLAPLAAVLSFLRQEGPAYHQVAGRAGEYTAEWTVADLPAFRRALIRAAPDLLRPRLAIRVAQQMVRDTYGGTRATARLRRGRGEVALRGSIFCEVREPFPEPLCEYHAAAIRRLLYLFNLHVDVEIRQCRGMGGTQCIVSIEPRGASA
jgi:hypothetical protein